MSKYKELREKGIISSKKEIGEQLIAIKNEKHKNIEKKINEDIIYLDDWKKLRGEMTLNEWIDFLLTSVGYEPKNLLFYEKILLLIRLLPFCEKGYHVIEMGPKSLGKSYPYGSLSDKSIVISGSLKLASLFLNKRGKEPTMGVINTFPYKNGVVAFDEMAEVESVPEEVVTALRVFMADGSSGRDLIEMHSDASLVFLGNVKDEDLQTIKSGEKIENDLYDCFPSELSRSPFKSRLAFMVPSWKFSENKNWHNTEGEGVVADYLISILIKLRDEQFDILKKDISNEDSRGKISIRATVSGLLKLLYPHGQYGNWEQEALYNIAVYGKKLVTDQMTRLQRVNENSDMEGYKNFILKANMDYLKSLGINSVERAYYRNDRLLVKPLGENKLYKIALEESGVKLNSEEYSFYYNQGSEKTKYIAPITGELNNFTVIVQEYFDPKVSRGKISMTNFKPSTFNFDKIQDPEIRTELKNYVENQKDELKSFKKEIIDLEQRLGNKENENKELKHILQEYLRGIKLEILELKSWMENNGVPFQNISESVGFLELVKDKEILVEEAKNALNFKELRASDYHIDDISGIKVINFGHLI